MSANQTVLEALAQEGIRITEEELLRVMERVPCESTSRNGAVAYPHGMRNGKAEEGGQHLTLESNTNTTQLDESRPVAAHFTQATDQYAPLTGQGQDRTRVPWYAAVLCRVAIHRGQWEYLAEGHCAQTRTCERCGTTKVRTKHQREWRSVGVRNCDQVLTCGRCGTFRGQRTRHEAWESGGDVISGEGERARQCLRCGVVEILSG